MPLFKRHDGDLVRDLPAMRRIMPYLMRVRNESVVYHESVYRMPAARAWLKAYNRSHAAHATVFHLFAYACGQALHARPELNRFISGSRLYQRRGVQISFVVKREMSDSGVGTTVKVDALREEPFVEFVQRIVRIVEEGRGPDRAVDKETVLVMKLPGPLVRMFVAIARWLDHWNLYPRLMTENDPMYASLFLANLGSAGISDAYHHLFEYGTCSIFGVMSAVRRMPFADGPNVVSAEGLSIRWTFDERIHDAFYAARSLAIVQRILEDPTRYLGPPEGDPAFRPQRRPAAANPPAP
ncbi:MAG TPA: 2-oxo acid dehydrogenase subunit E2 [Steroidobacteraceae bacterium]|nr:2-oxo acid dehydrogenase subunit E2 [Steroidobacteraceae bacterium]